MFDVLSIIEAKKTCPRSVPTVKFSNGDIIVSPMTRMTKSLFIKPKAVATTNGIKLKKSRSFHLNTIDYELCDEIVCMRKIKEFDSFSDYGSYLTDFSPLSETNRSNSSKKNTPSSIDGGFEENYSYSPKITPELASYFSFNPYAGQFNTIEKSLIKQNDHKVRAFNEITLLSIELDSPIVIKSQKIVQETPLLITKLDKNQIRVNRQTRQLNVCYQLNDVDFDDQEAKTPRKIYRSKIHPSQNTIHFEQNNRRKIFANDSSPLQPPPAPGCIQSLTLMIKYIKEKLTFKPKEEKESDLNQFGETNSSNDDEF